ncbi:MAG: hypothetical protein R3325_11000 [Thermoanaerobaculia bacterium]|nr:hypothetical protein [Thermoanaerobaculia bacterium]
MSKKKGPTTGRRGGGGRKTRESRGFLLPFAGEENTTLGREFLEDPKKFLRSNGLRAADLECRPEVHAAIERGEKFGDAVLGLGGTATDIKMLEPLKKLAAEHFGENYEVAMVPYGLKFRERARFQNDLTATGSGTITFCDKDADVDG